MARALHDSGVEALFGLLGDGNMFHCTDFMLQQGRFIGAVHEGGAVSMADAYARVSGKVGVASVTHGPGAANTINAMIDAVRAHTPMVLITGDTAAARRAYPQQIDLRALFAGTGAKYQRVALAEQAVDELCSALAGAEASRCPVVLDVPIDIQFQEVEYQRSGFIQHPPKLGRPREEDLDELLGMLAGANRPLILAGRGAVLSGAGPALIELADQLGAPLATTAAAKDLFHGHPYNLGIMGNFGFPWAVDVMAKADCVAAFGAALNNQTTSSGDLLRGKRVAHIDAEPSNLGRVSPVDLAICADARETARTAVERLAAADLPPGGFRSAQLGDGVLSREPRGEFTDTSADTTVDMRTAMIVLDELLPPQRSLVTDGGRFVSAPLRYLHVREASAFTQPGSWGTIGTGVAATVGAAVGRPDLLAVGVCGDGGAMQGLIEFSTAARSGIPLVLVVLNDHAYGAEYAKYRQHDYDPEYAYIDWPEFADVARALGGQGVTVRNVDELRALGPRLSDVTGPLLIDIKCDPTVGINQ